MLKSLWIRVKGRVRQIRNARKLKKIRKDLRVSEVTILSQNCIAGVFYHDMNLPFQSPTINLYFSSKDFIRFVNQLDYYLTEPLRLEFSEKEGYPIGTLDDVTLYFMHYHTCEEAATAWERRKERIRRDHLVVFCTDMEEFDDEAFAQWQQITYPKVLFTANEKYKNCEGTVYFPEYQDRGRVPDLIPKREFYKDGILMNVVNNIL